MGFFLIFFLIKNEKLWVRNRSHTEFCGDPIFLEFFFFGLKFNQRMMRFFILVKLGMLKLRRLSSLILRSIPSIGPFEYLANLGLAAFKT